MIKYSYFCLLLLGLLSAPLLVAQNTTPPSGASAAEELKFWEQVAYWETIKNSSNSQDFIDYLQAYPDGHFKPLADARLRLLKDQAVTPAQPAVVTRQQTAITKPAPQQQEPAAPERLIYRALTNSNVRAEPTTRSARIGLVRKNETVTVIAAVAQGKWYQIVYKDDVTGFIHTSLLEQDEAATAAANTTAVVDSTAAPAAQQLPAQQPILPTQPAPAVGTVFSDCEQCPQMVVIPPGTAMIGADDQQAQEAPAHQVNIGYRFALSVYEITSQQWSACVAAGGCSYQPPVADTSDFKLPVSNISWDDANQYTAWLSVMAGTPYRLPSEAEWEYAARAGASSAYWWGDEALAQGRANCRDCGSQWDNQGPAPVGSFAANAFGLYDVHGNVWEWAADCWNRDHQGAPADGSVRNRGDCLARVLRGGSWQQGAEAMRVSQRRKFDRDSRDIVHGFRVVKVYSSQEP